MDIILSFQVIIQAVIIALMYVGLKTSEVDLVEKVAILTELLGGIFIVMIYIFASRLFSLKKSVQLKEIESIKE